MTRSRTPDPTGKLPAAVVALVASLDPHVRSLVLGVRELVLATLPGATEVPDAKARVIGYGYGTGYKDMVATIILSRKGVKLGLVQGASLDDPSGLLEGEGKVHRHIPFAEPGEIERPAVKALIRVAHAAWKERSAERAWSAARSPRGSQGLVLPQRGRRDAGADS